MLRDLHRVAAVRSDGLVDCAPEEPFHRYAALAKRMLRVAWAFVTFVDDSTVYYKSVCGPSLPTAFMRPGVAQSFCAYVVDAGETLLIADTRRDPRFSDYPCVATGPFRSYAGAPVFVDDLCLGTLCVVDDHPRAWTQEDAEVLVSLAAGAASEVRLYRASQQLQRTAQQRAREAEE